MYNRAKVVTLDCALEEGFTRLTRGNPVVKTGRNVAADKTEPLSRILLVHVVLLQEKSTRTVILPAVRVGSERTSAEVLVNTVTAVGGQVFATRRVIIVVFVLEAHRYRGVGAVRRLHLDVSITVDLVVHCRLAKTTVAKLDSQRRQNGSSKVFPSDQMMCYLQQVTGQEFILDCWCSQLVVYKRSA